MGLKVITYLSLALIVISQVYDVDAQSPPCVTELRAGSRCIEKRLNCPAGTTEFPGFSNYLGCQGLNQKCCQTNDNTPRFLANDRNVCGLGSFQPTSKILDGTQTGVCDWPFVVSIRGRLLASSTLDYAGTTHACQGILIDPQWVLTSPYCVFSAANSVAEAPSSMLVVAGEYNITTIDIFPTTGTQQEQLIKVERAVVHPSYPFSRRDELITRLDQPQEINGNAVALLKLSEPISGTCSGVACLPSPEEISNQCLREEECVITGWGFSTGTFEGLSDILTLGQVRMTSAKACDFLTERLSLAGVRPPGSACRAPRNSNTDSCLGDEGGAVLCANGLNWVVRAILPFNKCQRDRFNLFVTDVATYMPWIQNTIRNTATYT